MCTSVPQERWSSAHRDYISLLFFFFLNFKYTIHFRKLQIKKKKRNSGWRDFLGRVLSIQNAMGENGSREHALPLEMKLIYTHYTGAEENAENFSQMPLWDCSGLRDLRQGYHAGVSIWRGCDSGTAQLHVRELWQVLKLKEPSGCSNPGWGKSVLRARELELAPWQPFLLPGGKSSAIWAQEHLPKESWICLMLEIVQLKVP